MKVFKFGGASIKDANSIKNMSDIVAEYPDDRLVIVVSAMGKTTNHLEKIVFKKLKGENFNSELTELSHDSGSNHKSGRLGPGRPSLYTHPNWR